MSAAEVGIDTDVARVGRILKMLVVAGVPAGMFLAISDAANGDRLLVAAVLAASALITAAAAPATVRVAAAVLPVVWGATAVGVAIQLRLGADPSRIAAFVAAAGVAFAISSLAVARYGATVRHSPRVPIVGAVLLTVALVARLVPFIWGTGASGTVPIAGQSIQIGEFTRLLLVAGCALVTWYIVSTRELGANARVRLLAGAGTLAVANIVLLFVVDSGPAIVSVVAIVTTIAFTAGQPRTGRMRLAIILALFTACSGAVALLSWTGAGDRLAARVVNVLNPEYQLRMALDAAAGGGLIGRGIGSSPSAGSIPEASTDMAPAVVAADLGYLILAILVGAVLLALASSLTRLSRLGTPVAAAGFGLLVALITQIVITVAGSLGGIPLTGLSTSIITVTGSTIIPTFVALGIACGSLAFLPAGGVALANHRRFQPAMRMVTIVMMVFIVSRILVPADSTAGATFRPSGPITTADGTVIAFTDQAGARIYPEGALYTEVGYSVPGYASYGLESQAAAILTCTNPTDLVEQMLQVFRPLRCEPAGISTTLSSHLQKAAASATDGLDADVVVTDSWTGDVLALYSAGQTPQSGLATEQFPDAPSRRESTAPGSTFKIIVATAALVLNVDAAGASTEVTDTGSEQIRNNGGFVCPDTSLVSMIAYSCNTSASTLALREGATALQNVAATYFGADSNLPFDGGEMASLRTGLDDGPLSPGQLARTGIGQESVRTSALALAAATGVIAVSATNTSSGGAIPAPHLIGGLCRSGMERPQALDRPEGTFGKLLPEGIGGTVLDAMRASADYGTTERLGNLGDTLGRDIAAKSGTAEVAESPTGIDSWLTAVIDTRYVVTVLVRGGSPATNQAVDVAVGLLPAIPTADDTASSQCQKPTY